MNIFSCYVSRNEPTENSLSTSNTNHSIRNFTYNENFIQISLPKEYADVKEIKSAGEKHILYVKGNIYSIQNSQEVLNFSEETLLNKIIAEGTGVIRSLEGAFSLIYLDLEHGHCFFARDTFGLKPLYYSSGTDYFYCTSTMRVNCDTQKIDKDHLATLLQLRFLPAPLTLVADYKKVVPAEILKIDLNGVKLNINSLNTPSKTILEKNVVNKSLLDQYGELIAQAIEKQLPKNSTEKIGLFLSGGVDSALLAALLSKSASPLKAFTVGFEERFDENEVEDATEIAKRFGIEQFVTIVKFEDFLKTIEDCNKILEEPLGTTSVIPMYHLAALASQHVSIAFSGQGPDEMGGGYTKYQGELLAGMVPRAGISLFAKLLPPQVIKNEKLRRAFYALSETNDKLRYQKITTLFEPEEIRKLLGIKERCAETVIASRFKETVLKSSVSSVEKMMALDLRMSLADDLMAYTDSICGHFKIDCRAPYMDPKIVAFMEQIDRSEKIRFQKGKILHREFAATLIPSKVTTRKKKGFLSPTRIWFTEYNEYLEDLLLSSDFFTEIFNPLEVRHLFHQHKKGYNYEKQLFLLLSIFFWMKHRARN